MKSSSNARHRRTACVRESAIRIRVSRSADDLASAGHTPFVRRRPTQNGEIKLYKQTFVRHCFATRVAATLPGYASVARAAEVLHLARRSVRDLIYSGRLPSVRLGRLHFIKASNLEQERRRRLGLPIRHRANARRVAHNASRQTIRPRQDPALRRQRAAARAELVRALAQRHHSVEPRVPAAVKAVTTPVTCEACGRAVRSGRLVELEGNTLCTACGRRALLEWADRRRQEASAARRMAESLGQPEPATPEARAA